MEREVTVADIQQLWNEMEIQKKRITKLQEELEKHNNCINGHAEGQVKQRIRI